MQNRGGGGSRNVPAFPSVPTTNKGITYQKKAQDSGGEKAIYAGWFMGVLAVFCGVWLMVQILARVS